MSCYNFCNPRCGNCKPALIKVIHCDACDKFATFKREVIRSDTEYFCNKCGAPFPVELVRTIPPVQCAYSGLPCAFPCNRATKEAAEISPCDGNVPPWE